MLEGEVLAELEGSEAVDGDVSERRHGASEVSLQQETVASEAREKTIDGGRRAVEGAGGLAVGGAVDGEMEELGEQVGSLQPVRGGEGLGGEGATAVATLETLDAVGFELAVEVSHAAVAPAWG
jgi:hypothetical protein